MNRATADNQSAQSEEEGLEPTKEWVKDLIDEIIAEEFDSSDLELAWLVAKLRMNSYGIRQRLSRYCASSNKNVLAATANNELLLS
jgi:hypothetical protein